MRKVIPMGIGFLMLLWVPMALAAFPAYSPGFGATVMLPSPDAIALLSLGVFGVAALRRRLL